jgi:hypothetical protein
LVTAVSLFFGLYFNRLWEQHRALINLQRQCPDAHIVFAYELGVGKPIVPGPLTLRHLLGDKFFAPVQAVTVSSPEVDDSTLEMLAALSDLQNLSIQSNRITDVGMSQFRYMTSLEELSISSDSITERGLAELGHIHTLKTLSVTCHPLTDAMLGELGKCVQLESLSVCGPQITASGLSSLLSHLTELEFLGLYTRVLTATRVRHQY